MPVYEFYCPACHVRLSFFSRRIDTTTQPACPHCQRPQLKRQLSLFNTGSKSDSQMDAIASEDVAVRSLGERLSELDHRDNKNSVELAAALYETRGARPGEAMQTALSRLEAGVDPVEIESTLGDAIDAEAVVRSDSMSRRGGAAAAGSSAQDRPPLIDPVTYPLNGEADE